MYPLQQLPDRLKRGPQLKLRGPGPSLVFLNTLQVKFLEWICLEIALLLSIDKISLPHQCPFNQLLQCSTVLLQKRKKQQQKKKNKQTKKNKTTLHDRF